MEPAPEAVVRESLTAEEWQPFIDGNGRVLTQLIARHTQALRRHARRFAADEDEIDDLCQETWICAFDRRHQYRGGKFEAWLVAILSSLGKERLRRHKRRDDAWRRRLVIELSAEEQSDDERHPLLMFGGDLSRVLNTIAELPTRQRAIVERRIIQGLSVSETARELGCAPGTVKAALAQARRRIRERLSRRPATS